MKMLILALTLLFTPALGHAADVCAFGEATHELSEMLKAETSDEKIWYQGEHLSVHNWQRYKGLTKLERQMIMIAQGGAADGRDSDKDFDPKEAVQDFIRNEGYITYFRHDSNDREFAIVASYPGDNEYGVVIEIVTLKRRSEFKILKIAATISDGDFMDCVVNK